MFRLSRQLLRVGANPHRHHLALAGQPALAARLFQPTYQRANYSTKDKGSSSSPASSGRPPFSEVDPEAERKIAMRPIRTPPPEQVSSSSTLANAIPQTHTDASQPDVVSGIKQELSDVKDAFALDTVPKEAYALGLAGTLPYLATSLSTLYLSWNLNQNWPGSGFFSFLVMKHESAQNYINLIEPVQLGYGAVIISFLGAIHWGMEWNERNSAVDRTRTRYLIGAIAPALAWPTLLLPVHWALTGQFLAFSGLYFVDARMAERGWAPRWYSPYRFVLTLVTGVAIFASLVGRAKIGEKSKGISSEGLRKRVLDMGPAEEGKGHNWDKEEEEARERFRKKKAAEENAKAREDAKSKNKDDKEAKKQEAKKEESNEEEGKEEQSDEEQGQKVKEKKEKPKSEDDTKSKSKQESKEQKGGQDATEGDQQPESNTSGKGSPKDTNSKGDNKSRTETEDETPDPDEDTEKEDTKEEDTEKDDAEKDAPPSKKGENKPGEKSPSKK